MRNTWKKVLFSLWAIGLVWAGSLWLVNAQNSQQVEFWSTAGTPFWQNEAKPSLNVIWDKETASQSTLISTIKTFVNWILWMLSLIALVLCLWGWFQMLTAGWDETKYKKWFTILKQAGLWLAIIWLSWLIVSLIFRLINNSAQTSATPSWGNA